MASSSLRLSLPQEGRGQTKTRSTALIIGCLCAAFACAVLLCALPDARNGLKALCNRLFERSESVNSYRYDRFDVLPGQDTGLAAALLAGLGLFLTGALILGRRRLPVIGVAVSIALGQAYFGLALPVWLNIALYAALGLLLMRSRRSKRAGAFVVVILLIAGVLLAAWPQVDDATEAASERARDWLSRAAQTMTGGASETPANALNETRHVNTQSLADGDRDALTDKDYRLLTVEEEEISRPHWIDYLRIALLLLLAAMLVILPFIPFVALDRRRKQARSARERFASEDCNEAICALFGHVTRYLEATGHGGGNRLYRAWDTALSERMPESYIDSFRKCCILYEEAAYSEHELAEEQRLQVSALLAETEKLLFDQADWKQRLKLRYVECLHE